MLLLKAPSDYFLRTLAQNAGLEAIFDSFMDAARPPDDMQGLLFGVNRLRTILTDPTLQTEHPHWNQLQPFSGWIVLFDLFLADAAAISAHYKGRPAQGFTTRVNRRSILEGQMEEYPFFAMVCTQYGVTSYELEYGGLQLQVLWAHWEKVDAFRRKNPNHVGRVWELTKDRASKSQPLRDIKLGHDACRAVRTFSAKRLHDELKLIRPLDHPHAFAKTLKTPPGGELSRAVCTKVRRYFDEGYDPGPGGSGGERVCTEYPRLFLVNYLGLNYGLTAFRPDDPNDGKGEGERSPRHEIFVRPRVIGEHGGVLTDQEILNLGLDPLEMGGGADILTEVGAGQDRHEAREAAHARAQAFEIDRRLFPWNSDTIRLEEFQNEILPIIEEVRRDSGATYLDVFGAAVLCTLAETGRSLDELRELRIEQTLSSRFAYRPPEAGKRCGTWQWDAVSARYEAELHGDEDDLEKIAELQAGPAQYLRFPASEMVTDLIAKLMEHMHGGVATTEDSYRLFNSPKKNFASNFRLFLRAHHKQLTATCIRQLIWNVLHQATGGELASACLTLGLAHPMAQVELFYATLHETEARGLFERAKFFIWTQADRRVTTPEARRDPAGGKFTGCRAFPRIEEVRTMIGRLREASRRFFSMRLSSFDPKCEHDRQTFNYAVMYCVWHQAFSFGTRAITDSYQPLQTLSHQGIGFLDDKGFAQGYRTRIVVADEHLRMHMRTLERRLADLAGRIQGEKPGVLWLLDEGGEPVKIRPATIFRVLQKEFPFPINVPRKVMRYLLRKSGMSHTHAEAYMGHWWHGREPFSPSSSFDFGAMIEDLKQRLPKILRHDLGFWPVPGVRADGN